MVEENYSDFVEKKLSKKVARLNHYKVIRGNFFIGVAFGALLYFLSGDNNTGRYMGLATAVLGTGASITYKRKMNKLERQIEEDRRTLMIGGVIEDE